MGGFFKKILNPIAGIIKGIGKIVGGIVKGIIDFVGDVIGFVLNPFGIFDAPTIDDPGQQAQGVTITKSGTNVAIPVVYGHRLVGGTIVYAETNGTNNKYLYVVYAVAEGEIQGFHKIFVDDTQLPLPADGKRYAHGANINVSAGKYKGRMRFQCFNGTEGQGQSSLANESASWSKKRRRLPGVAYVACRFEWKEIKSQEDADNNPYRGGIPQLKFEVLGKKVYNVRNHSGGGKDLVGSYASRTKTWSRNPVSCLLDYLENPRYGAGLAATEIDAEAFRIAANKCATSVNYSSTQTGPILTMNAVVQTQQKVIDNVKILTAGCRGIMPYVQGRYKLKMEDGGHPTDVTSTTVEIAYDVTSDVIIGGINLDGERKNSKYNQVIVNYIDPDLKFTNQQVVHSVSGDQTIDNDEELTADFTFHTVTNKAIARDLAAMIYKKSRNQTQVSFTATQELLDVEVGDIIRVTDTVLNLANDTYRVVGMKLKNDGFIDVEAVEHDATVYPFTTGEQIEIPPPIYLPDEYIIVPTPDPVPEQPVGVVPPIDDDDPDDGDSPNPPPDTGIVIVPTPRVNVFQDLEENGPNGVKFYSIPGLPHQVIKESQNFAQSSTAGFMYKPYRAFDLFGLARDMGGSYLFCINAPTDSTIDELVIRTFKGGTVYGYEQVINFRSGRHIEERSGLVRHKSFYWGPDEQDVVYKVAWRKSASGIEIPDGSDFAALTPEGNITSVFPGYTYNGIDGQSVTDNGIDGLLNYLLDYHYTNLETATLLSKNVNLGG